MDKIRITDEQWQILEPLITQKNKSKAGKPKVINDKKNFENILWVLCSHSSWRSLPKDFGSWQAAYKMFNCLIKKNTFQKIIELSTIENNLQPLFNNDFHAYLHNYFINHKKRMCKTRMHKKRKNKTL